MRSSPTTTTAASASPRPGASSTPDPLSDADPSSNPDPTSDLDPPRPRAARPGAWRLLRPLVVRVHFWAGLLVGPFLLVAALTGLTYTATPVLEQLVYGSVLHTPAAGPTVPLADQVRTGRAAVPGAPLTAVRPAATATDTTQVAFAAPDRGSSSYHRTAFVDPHTGALRGVYDTFGSDAALPLRGWVDQLHDNLHLGTPGRLYSELAASWLGVLTLAGLALWVGRRVRALWVGARAPGTGGRARAPETGGRARALARLVVPRRGGGRRARLLSWHAAVGTAAAVGLLFLSVTGLTWSTYAGANITALRHALSWQKPTVPSTLPGTAPGAADDMAGMPGMGASGSGPGVPAGDEPAVVDRAAGAAARHGIAGPVEIVPPSGPGGTVVVSGVGRTASSPLDAVSVDPGSGAVTGTVRFADWPLMAKLAQWTVDAHMGLLWGLPNQLALAALALGTACLVVWGHVLWWRRGPGRRAGTPPSRGVLRTLPPGLLVGVVLVAAVVAVLLPVLGVSLLGFLVVDALLGLRWGRRHRRPPEAAPATPPPEVTPAP